MSIHEAGPSAEPDDPSRQRLGIHFGVVGPSCGDQPWLLERKTDRCLKSWLMTADGISALADARVLRLELCEEFFFDTYGENNQHGLARSAAGQHRDVPVSPAQLMAGIRSILVALKKQFDVVEIVVNSLGERSCMSDYFPDELDDGPGVLRPTDKVYRDFMGEFTRLGKGVVKEVHLSGVFPDDWVGLIEARMGSRVSKDLSVFADEIGILTDPKIDCEGVMDHYGPAGPTAGWERRMRRCHGRAKTRMVRGASGRETGDDAQLEFDPGYVSES